MQNDANSIDRLASKPLEKPVKTLSEDHGHGEDNALLGSIALKLRNADWSKFERGSDAFLDINRDLKEVAADSPLKAAELWAGNAPKGINPPEYITESLEQLQRPLEAGKTPTGPEAGEGGYEIPGSLKKRYLEADGKFHFREAQNKLAFEDRGAKMVTEHNDPAVATSMVELAEAKGWSKLKVSGHDDFKREVWLQASLKGIEVTGFKPKEVDLAKLDELRSYRMKNAIEADAAAPGTAGKVERGIPMESQPGKSIVYNETPGMRGPEIVSADGTRTAFGGRDAIDRYAAENKLSPQDVGTLRDFDKRASEERTAAPTKEGKAELTGSYKVAASVMADVLKEKGYSPKVLDKAVAEATRRLEGMQKGGEPAPAVKMFDKTAPREREREQLKPSRSKQKEAERNR